MVAAIKVRVEHEKANNWSDLAVVLVSFVNPCIHYDSCFCEMESLFVPIGESLFPMRQLQCWTKMDPSEFFKICFSELKLSTDL